MNDTNLTQEIKRVKYRGVLEPRRKKIDCFVSEDGGRYLSTMGFQISLKMVDEKDKQKSGTRLGRYLGQKSLQSFIYKRKSHGHYDPAILYDGSQKISGHEATRLVDFSDGILEARNHIELDTRQEIIAKEAEIIIRAVAKTGIIALVDEATGYQAVREKTLQEILSLYISEEILKWQKTFHDEFYEQIFRLWGLSFTPEGIKKRPAFIGTLTNKLVYENLPKGVLEKIREKNPKDKKGRWKYHFHRWLTLEVGKEALKKVIYSVETLASISKDKNKFLRLVKEKYHPTRDFPYIDAEAMDSDKSETKFDKVLGTLLNTPKPRKK